jgi:hypothetical protein
MYGVSVELDVNYKIRRMRMDTTRADTSVLDTPVGKPPLSDIFLPARVIRVLNAVLAAVSIAVLADSCLRAVLWLRTYSHINHVSGAWMALTKYAASGVLYPPLYDGRRYGGTRFMPLTILLNTAASKVTGEFLTSGKLVALGSMALLLVLVFLVLRQLGCAVSYSLALTTAVIATGTGFDAAMSIRGDAIAVFWQLGAVAVIAGARAWAKDRTRVMVALTLASAALSTLGVLAKFSAVWAPLSISLWLLLRDRRALIVYVGAFTVLVLGSLTLFQFVSHGNMFDSVFGLAFAGVATANPVTRMKVLGHDIFNVLRVVWVLFPIALLGVITALRNRHLSIYHLSFLCAVGVTGIIYMDVGVEMNHLIDLAVLTVIVVGDFLASIASARDRSGILVLMTVLLIWTIPSSYALNVSINARDSMNSDNGKGTQRSMEAALAGTVRPTDTILSFDPAVPVGLGQFPEVLDFFMFARIQAKDPQAATALADRIQRREFDKIVHIDDLTKPGFNGERDFGPRVVAQIRANYRLAAHVRGYYVYVPVSAAAPDHRGAGPRPTRRPSGSRH